MKQIMHPFIFAGLPDDDQLLYRFGILKSDPNYIIGKTCEALDLSVDILKSAYRGREYSDARSIVVGLTMKVNKNMTLKRLGQILGGRDHSTIIYNQRLYENLSMNNYNFKQKLIKVMAVI